MQFTFEELISGIINSNITSEQKVDLISKIYRGGQITDCVFLKRINENLYECWNRTEDSGVQPSGYTIDNIISVFVEYNNKNIIK